VASFTALPTSGVAPLTVQVSDTSTGDITSREWDFNGDGNADATGATASHVFDTPGTYPVALTVTGPGDGMNTTTQTITVNVPQPVAAFDAVLSTSTAPLTVQLADTSSGAITSRAWTIGNDTIAGPGVPPTFSYVFEEAGTYTVTLTVTGPGGIDTATKQITVSAPNAAPSVMITAPESGASFPALSSVAFTATASDAEDGNISGSIEWSSSINWALGTGASISKSNLSAGTHTITALVTDLAGDTASASVSVTINPLPPPTLPDPPGGDPCHPRGIPDDPGDGPPDRR
jgi:PKD repeat protein